MRISEVQVAVHSVGICGSDIHFVDQGHISSYKVTDPIVIGHEPAGVVSKVGLGVSIVKVGDRVALEPGVPCGKCNGCRIGRYNLCQKANFLGSPPYHGAIARYVVHDASYCFKLPDNVSFEEGAMLQPLSIAIHSCRRAGITVGDRLLICGAGPIGLLCLMTARAMGATHICITDINERRLAMAMKLGVDQTVLVDTRDPEALSEKVINAMGCRPNVTMECSGVEASVQMTLLAAEEGGIVAIVGLGNSHITIPIGAASAKELDIRTVIRFANTYPAAVSMVTNGQVNLKDIITHRFKLEDTLKAFECFRTGADGSVKVIIECSKSE